MKKIIASKEKHWFPRQPKLMDEVLQRIKTEGPMQSRDFVSSTEKNGPWYDWKPAKRALELLFMEGKLMIRERKGFQKIYDLTERVFCVGTLRRRS